MDADGCYWFAAVDAGRIVRVDPQGREIGHVALPVSRPTKLAFWGPDLDDLRDLDDRRPRRRPAAAQPLRAG